MCQARQCASLPMACAHCWSACATQQSGACATDERQLPAAAVSRPQKLSGVNKSGAVVHSATVNDCRWPPPGSPPGGGRPKLTLAGGHRAESQFRGAASYSHWRPAAVVHCRWIGCGAMLRAGPGYSIPARRAWFAIVQSPVRRRHKLISVGPATTAPAGRTLDKQALTKESNREPHHLDRRPYRHHPVHPGLLRPALNPRRVKLERL